MPDFTPIKTNSLGKGTWLTNRTGGLATEAHLGLVLSLQFRGMSFSVSGLMKEKVEQLYKLSRQGFTQHVSK